MAMQPLGERPLPFKIPTGLDAIKARDARFWTAYAAWREREDSFNAMPEVQRHSEIGELALDRATKLLEMMFATPVRTGTALHMKFEAIREGCWTLMELKLPCGLTVAQALTADVERIAKGEIWGSDAFEDMAEG